MFSDEPTERGDMLAMACLGPLVLLISVLGIIFGLPERKGVLLSSFLGTIGWVLLIFGIKHG